MAGTVNQLQAGMETSKIEPYGTVVFAIMRVSDAPEGPVVSIDAKFGDDKYITSMPRTVTYVKAYELAVFVHECSFSSATYVPPTRVKLFVHDQFIAILLVTYEIVQAPGAVAFKSP